jgi:transposase-like protein
VRAEATRPARTAARRPPGERPVTTGDRHAAWPRLPDLGFAPLSAKAAWRRCSDQQMHLLFWVERVLRKGRTVEPDLDGRVREALAIFADEISAHRYLERVLWPGGVCCPRCGDHRRVSELNGTSTRIGTYKCYQCRKIFSILHGTLMSASQVPAHKWLQAMYLTEGGIKPMRAHHLSRILNVSVKTAASMMRRIGDAREPASGFDSKGEAAGPAIDVSTPTGRRSRPWPA